MFQSKFFSSKNLLDWNIEYNLGLQNRLLKKDELLLEAGQRCDYFYFVLKGFLRVYYLDIDGNEITHWFSPKDTTITSPFSYFNKEENILFIQALEETDVLLISSDQLNTVIENVPSANKEARKLLAEFAMTFSRRVMEIHTKTAESRYLKLMAEHSTIFQKAKLSHIASFLGITQQSLSRIRKNI
ncbi:Crp/Fnr family transcriptional regulator [Winogradskyella sp.]|uniref:Crp/Fnr family transcriptional regulator n=1 Tax=Winogradskyella sp. TaxID=1883156 RepID=UPI00262CEB36|nr:Crp/Fnr family transcriptional regulator [Winogradskyella sp.]